MALLNNYQHRFESHFCSFISIIGHLLTILFVNYWAIETQGYGLTFGNDDGPRPTPRRKQPAEVSVSRDFFIKGVFLKRLTV